MSLNGSIQLLTKTAAQWVTWEGLGNILLAGQAGIDSTNNTVSFGDGVSVFSALPKFINRDAIEDLLDTPIRDCGNYDASVNVFPSTGGTGSAGAIEAGNLFTISVSGTLGGVTVTAPYDTIRARVSNPGQTLANWAITSNSVAAPITSQLFSYGVACSDLSTALTTGTNKAYFRAPHAMTNISLRASLLTVSSSGVVTIDVNVNGSTILSTKLTIDASEKTSVTAATAYVLTTTSIASDAEITFDIDGAGTGAKGLIVFLSGTR